MCECRYYNDASQALFLTPLWRPLPPDKAQAQTDQAAVNTLSGLQGESAAAAQAAAAAAAKEMLKNAEEGSVGDGEGSEGSEKGREDSDSENEGAGIAQQQQQRHVQHGGWFEALVQSRPSVGEYVDALCALAESSGHEVSGLMQLVRDLNTKVAKLQTYAQMWVCKGLRLAVLISQHTADHYSLTHTHTSTQTQMTFDVARGLAMKISANLSTDLSAHRVAGYELRALLQVGGCVFVCFFVCV